MEIGDLLDRRAVTPKAAAASKRQALSLVAETAARRFGLDASDVLEALLAREQLGSTGVGSGVAVPHAKTPGLDRMRGCCVRASCGCSFARPARPTPSMPCWRRPPRHRRLSQDGRVCAAD